MDRTERVLAAAAELFVRFGVAKTTVDEIARAAGISKGAIYLEFQSKDSLVEALVKHELRAYLRAAAARVEADEQGGRLSRIYHHCTAELLDRPFLRALYTRDVEVLGTRLRRDPPSPSGPRLALSEAFVERLRSAGLVRAEVDPAVLGHLMGVVSLGLIMIGPVRAGTETGPALLGQTLDLVADMFAATVDTPPGEGDVAAGKQAFVDLLGQIYGSLDGEKVTA
ncbi:DNA-binding transcriptional regulator, AcrR family [Actinopolymorpha cephalotaxi]|uniref:AcrR family transcriptional regulator n=1 Tax=Actinopolymorpha cephalotaxi TaxID=504797 RepID=A0A1I3BH07_9ACTN|nr:TetR/AcrR family transcriptional regulator [Actinopolymorpha cephalotaxi]NYH86384.1 AcrR family transcriptional regulator [Actinopolymorpha cephalotaxi]SFH61595.1 DNA-binding transcriptional regulator, AcrR family [Actinopolymorpha cephalotaxi]